MNMKNTALWGCYAPIKLQCFRGTCCLLLVCFMLYMFLTLKMEAVPSSETPLSSAALHSTTYQVIVPFKISSVRYRKKNIKILLLLQNSLNDR
jgi:hypothetical protein